VVDLLGGSAEQQVRELAAMDGLTGIAWGAHAVSEARPVLSAASSVPATAADKAAPVDAIGEFFRPKTAAVARPAASGPAEAASPPADQSIAKRLQTLQQLFDQKLIDETEYKQQKQRILKEL
jgi:hypothetical protein